MLPLRRAGMALDLSGDPECLLTSQVIRNVRGPLRRAGMQFAVTRTAVADFTRGPVPPSPALRCCLGFFFSASLSFVILCFFVVFCFCLLFFLRPSKKIRPLKKKNPQKIWVNKKCKNYCPIRPLLKAFV